MMNPLTSPLAMKEGRRLKPSPSLADVRARAAHDLERLPQPLRDLEPQANYPVVVAEALKQLAAQVDERIAQSEGVA